MFSSVVSSQSLTWKQRADYAGGEVFNPLWMVIDGKAYVGTGLSLPNTIRNDFWQYDPQTNVWTQKANVPGSGRYGAIGFSIYNYGFAGSGWTPSPVNDFYRYDPILNFWVQIASFPGQARYTATSFSLGSFGFVGLGFSPCMFDFWRYDPILDSWSQTANFPGGARQSVVSFVIDDFAYVGSGLCNGTLYNDFYRYDMTSNGWSQVSSLPTNGRTAGFSFVLNGLGYYLMGCDYLNNNQPFSLYNDMWQYNPVTDSWTQLPDFPGNKRFHGVAFNIGNKGYVGLGTDTTAFGTSYLSDFWEYSADTLSSLIEGRNNISISIFPNPAQDMIFIDSSAKFESDSLIVSNTSGQKVNVDVVSKTDNSIQLGISGLKPGLYFVIIGNHQMLRFIKH